MNEYSNLISIIIGIVGLIVGYFQNRQKAHFQRIIRANSWYNFQRAKNSNGTLQSAIQYYKYIHNNSIDSEVLSQLTKSDAFGQEVYKEAIRQIHFSEPSFTILDIDRWEKAGKINERDKIFFANLVESENLK